ncbi:hypothetical protein CHELA1G11_20560 [Hyphomicrobiales bacterium]|nr:hypothetical protein CHELA1G11_20560 [Hyphomicrobiales bacterium]CAH1690800.1 hypothetical protein CHELA1G2_20875 [Hyphomicrobiales bacterium]
MHINTSEVGSYRHKPRFRRLPSGGSAGASRRGRAPRPVGDGFVERDHFFDAAAIVIDGSLSNDEAILSCGTENGLRG